MVPASALIKMADSQKAGGGWLPCIITLFDAIGIKDLAATGQGSAKMIDMHNRAVRIINNGMSLHSYGYVWNDSVMLVSYQIQPQVRHTLFSELSYFKLELEQACGLQVFVISVMGMAFPQTMNPLDSRTGQVMEPQRAVVLKTSSWAMANCSVIEQKLARHRADWYLDCRITRGADLPSPFVSKRVRLLPGNERRTIHMYKGSLLQAETSCFHDHVDD